VFATETTAIRIFDLFHVLVLLREQKLPLDEVLKELAARHLKRK
jgi:phosphoribosyl-ATP pyrophosphohydrolase